MPRWAKIPVDVYERRCRSESSPKTHNFWPLAVVLPDNKRINLGKTKYSERDHSPAGGCGQRYVVNIAPERYLSLLYEAQDYYIGDWYLEITDEPEYAWLHKYVDDSDWVCAALPNWRY